MTIVLFHICTCLFAFHPSVDNTFEAGEGMWKYVAQECEHKVPDFASLPSAPPTPPLSCQGVADQCLHTCLCTDTVCKIQRKSVSCTRKVWRVLGVTLCLVETKLVFKVKAMLWHCSNAHPCSESKVNRISNVWRHLILIPNSCYISGLPEQKQYFDNLVEQKLSKYTIPRHGPSFSSFSSKVARLWILKATHYDLLDFCQPRNNMLTPCSKSWQAFGYVFTARQHK